MMATNDYNLNLRKAFLEADTVLQIQHIEFELAYNLLLNVSKCKIKKLPQHILIFC